MHEDSDRFDAEFFRRYYGDPDTRVADEDDAERIGGLIGGIVRYMELPVRTILDAGCGIGMLREPLLRHFPGASYEGLEYSTYLCGEHGWTQGSVADHVSPAPYDLVVCHDVLQYLDDRSAARSQGPEEALPDPRRVAAARGRAPRLTLPGCRQASQIANPGGHKSAGCVCRPAKPATRAVQAGIPNDQAEEMAAMAWSYAAAIALEIDPHFAGAHNNFGVALAGRGLLIIGVDDDAVTPDEHAGMLYEAAFEIGRAHV